MVRYNQVATKIISSNKIDIHCFESNDNQENIDQKTVDSFGEEWSKFANFNNYEINKIGDEYTIMPTVIGFDSKTPFRSFDEIFKNLI